MLKVIIFGAGGGGKRIGRWVDHQQAEIIAYADNDLKKKGQTINGVRIIAPGSIRRYEYDYIIIASSFYSEITPQLIGSGVPEEKIICMFKYWKVEFKYLLEQFEKCGNKTEVIITGISYAECGIKSDCLTKKAFNFALPSQDLYYDYHVAKYILNGKHCSKIKYFIICLAYYNFQYDLSKCGFKDRIFRYGQILDKYHGISGARKEYKAHERKLRKIFCKHAHQHFYSSQTNEIEKQKTEQGKKGKGDLIAGGEFFERSKKQAKKDYRKNYPETVLGNKIIFSKYLDLLLQKGIRPICIVLPAHEMYVRNVPHRLEVEFKDIMTELRTQYGFQYYDFFNSSLFGHNDFRDGSHLNKAGAEKFTKILNNTIMWN